MLPILAQQPQPVFAIAFLQVSKTDFILLHNSGVCAGLGTVTVQLSIPFYECELHQEW